MADAAVMATYRAWLEDVAAEEVDKLIARGATVDRHVLIAAAMEPLERALRFYRRHDSISPRGYPFSAYYRWWARQFATARLHRSP